MKFFSLYFHSELVSYHWLGFFFPLWGLWRTVHWLFEVASKRKWGEKALLILRFVWLKHRGQKNTSGVRCWQRHSHLSRVSATEGRRKKTKKKKEQRMSPWSHAFVLFHLSFLLTILLLLWEQIKPCFAATGDKPLKPTRCCAALPPPPSDSQFLTAFSR